MSIAEPLFRLDGRRALIAFALLLTIAEPIFARNLTDFSVYYQAGRSLLAGRTDLYAADFARGPVMDYRYPPLFLLLVSPLAQLPYKAAAWLWHVFNVCGICWSIVLLDRLFVAPSRRRGYVWTLAFFGVVPYLLMMLSYGNAHLIAVVLMFGGLYLAARRRQIGAAALLALAATIKVTPLLLVPYFAVKRRYALAGLVVAVTVALNLAPAAYFGVAPNASLLREWYGHVVVNQDFHETNGPINLSLKGQLRRYLTQVDYGQRLDGDTQYAVVNVMSLPASLADGWWIGLSAGAFLVCLGLVAWSDRRSMASGDDRALEPGHLTAIEGLQVALMICLMLLVGPLTSKIYFVSLLWPVVSLTSATSDRPIIRRGLLSVVVLSSTLPLLPGRQLQRLLLVLGVDFYLACVLLALVATTLVLEQRSARRVRSA